MIFITEVLIPSLRLAPEGLFHCAPCGGGTLEGDDVTFAWFDPRSREVSSGEATHIRNNRHSLTLAISFLAVNEPL